jgi:hypothetical protein
MKKASAKASVEKKAAGKKKAVKKTVATGKKGKVIKRK